MAELLEGMLVLLWQKPERIVLPEGHCNHILTMFIQPVEPGRVPDFTMEINLPKGTPDMPFSQAGLCEISHPTSRKEPCENVQQAI